MSGNSSSRQMSATGKRWRKSALPLADLATGVLAPIVARRASMSVELLAAWPEIAGPAYGQLTRPEKIKWPRHASHSEPFSPGTLVLAADPRVALQLQHEVDELLDRANLFFGFKALARLQIRQKPVRPPMSAAARDEPAVVLSKQQDQWLGAIVKEIEDPELRARLEKLGRGVAKRAAIASGKAEKPGR